MGGSFTYRPFQKKTAAGNKRKNPDVGAQQQPPPKHRRKSNRAETPTSIVSAAADKIIASQAEGDKCLEAQFDTARAKY